MLFTDVLLIKTSVNLILLFLPIPRTLAHLKMDVIAPAYQNIVVMVSSHNRSELTLSLIECLCRQGRGVDVVLCDETQFLLEDPHLKSLPVTVHFDMFAPPQKWNLSHLSLSEKADLFLLPFVSVNLLSKISIGLADDLQSSTLAARGKTPVMAFYLLNAVAPHSPLPHHFRILKERGVEVSTLNEKELSVETLLDQMR